MRMSYNLLSTTARPNLLDNAGFTRIDRYAIGSVIKGKAIVMVANRFIVEGSSVTKVDVVEDIDSGLGLYVNSNDRPVGSVETSVNQWVENGWQCCRNKMVTFSAIVGGSNLSELTTGNFKVSFVPGDNSKVIGDYNPVQLIKLAANRFFIYATILCSDQDNNKANNLLGFRFVVPDYFDGWIGNPKVEVGSVYTSFELGNAAINNMQCDRFCQPYNINAWAPVLWVDSKNDVLGDTATRQYLLTFRAEFYSKPKIIKAYYLNGAGPSWIDIVGDCAKFHWYSQKLSRAGTTTIGLNSIIFSCEPNYTEV